MLLSGMALTHGLHAQEPALAEREQPEGNLLLTSEELTYNLDEERVVASGAVQIDYGGYQMVADRVEYDQQTGRLYAVGNIELIEPDGNRIYAEELDITDDFGDGFVNALRIETPDNTRLVAESAERTGGTETTLNNGVYTACEVCEENPERPPLWQIKARRVIQNGENQTIRLEGARFELFGRPIAYLPYLVVPDYQKKRQSGFLFPSASYADDLGLGVTVPYYFALSPHMDATVSVTGYSNQGFLTEAEFRRRFSNGDVTLRAAGIYQMSPEEFDERTVDWDEDLRGLVNSTGRFEINSRWTFGWDLTLQSDKNFGETYRIDGFAEEEEISEIYLTGLNDRNYFDMRGFYFDIQTPFPDNFDEEVQPIVHPTIDYAYTLDQPIFGGETTLDVNLTSLSREREEFFDFTDDRRDRLRGVDGWNNRLTGEVEWRRRITTDAGIIITPLAALRGDLHANDLEQTAALASVGGSDDDFQSRSMVTAGVEASYPILATTATSSHVIEPVAQLFVRPNEPLSGGLPNEDAQSFVFDATSLFERDKFSGYDRIEGGTRANVGFRYTGTFDNGYRLNAIVGQSYHLAGENSFATDDFVNAGANSGLETDVSDFVGQVGVQMPNNIALRAGARFDKDTFDVDRADVAARYANDRLSVGAGMTFVRAQPEYSYDRDRYEVRGDASLRVTDNWSVFGAASYDAREHVLTDASIGLGYDDECFSFRIAYIEERDRRDLSGPDWSIGASLSFRTLGDIAFND
ncbi:LPS-assembly protein LptD [Pararhizobium haloflavum]|uniref:LPS-assembly protein LptD n=1 Tax=Pararhizobium haloflavum TaxID=2037914 RepID=UPI003F9C9BCB